MGVQIHYWPPLSHSASAATCTLAACELHMQKEQKNLERIAVWSWEGLTVVHNIPSSAGLAASRYSISAVHRSADSCPLHRKLPAPQSVSAKFHCSDINSKSAGSMGECVILSPLWCLGVKVLSSKFLLFPSGILIKRTARSSLIEMRRFRPVSPPAYFCDLAFQDVIKKQSEVAHFYVFFFFFLMNFTSVFWVFFRFPSRCQLETAWEY